MIRDLFIFALLGLAYSTCQAITLLDLEQKLPTNERRLQMAIQETRIAQAQFVQREAESGWKAFANANGGSTTLSASNPGMQTGNSQYGTYGYTAGFSYPLLGTQSLQQKRILEARKTLETSKLDSEAIKRQGLQDLRQSYLNLWVSEQQVNLAKSYLDFASQTINTLAQRKNAGLLLSSKEKEFQTGFSEVDLRLQQALEQKAVSKKNIQYLTGISIEDSSPIEPPNFLVKIDQDPGRANNQPEVQAAKLRLDIQREYSSKSEWDGVEASMDLSYNDGRQYWNPTVPSSNALVALNLKIPLDLAKYQQGAQLEKLATLEKLRIESEDRIERYSIESDTAIMNYRSANANLKISELERLTAKQVLQESELRSQVLPGDALEKKFQARYTYYKAASKQLNFWLQTQVAAIQLASLGYPLETLKTIPIINLTNQNRFGDTQGPNHPSISFGIPTGVYVWNSKDSLVDPRKSITEWQRFGITTVLIGLTSAQLKSSSTLTSLDALVKIAHESKIQVELVLGDPNWILPEGRSSLMKILSYLSSVPVDGINLDLEIEQLSNWEQRTDLLTKEWLTTLSDASKSAGAPVSATFHHRHLNVPNLNSKLLNAGIKKVAIMVFTTNQARTLEINALALKKLQGVSYAIVKSVESHLPTTESYAASGLGPLIKLSKELKSQGESSLLIQSWKNLKTLSQ